jgi:uncharacterized membrane protein
MLKIGAKGQKWLKGLHLICVACWIGGAVSLLVLYPFKNGVEEAGVLYGINQSIHHVDMVVVVIPGAIGCLLTGLIYSIFTRWGFFTHGWVTIKWVVTLGGIIFGTFWLGPWETRMMELSGQLGLSALRNAEYLDNERLNAIWGTVQCLTLMVTVFISILKPWKNWRKPKT